MNSNSSKSVAIASLPKVFPAIQAPLLTRPDQRAAFRAVFIHLVYLRLPCAILGTAPTPADCGQMPDLCPAHIPVPAIG